MKLVEKKQCFILILSCSGGGGHIRAAEGLHQTAQTLALPLVTKQYDVLEFTSPLFKRLYAESYLRIVNSAPELWGYMYDRAEARPYSKQGLIKLFDYFNYKKYREFLKHLQPDVVLCTHFLPFLALAELQQKEFSFPFYAVTTDFDVHQFWVSTMVERYYVFSHESQWQLSAKGIEESRIKVTGIPLLPAFSQKLSRSSVRQKLSLPLRNFTILIMSGGFGTGQVQETTTTVLRTLAEHQQQKFTVVVVCGKNEELRQSLLSLSSPANTHLTVLGFLQNIYDYMDAADILVSKAGGLTSSEALAKQLPMIIVNPIPGQETRNSDILIEHGCAWKAHNQANLSYKLRLILENPKLLLSARRATKTLAQPHASKKILLDVFRQFHRSSKR